MVVTLSGLLFFIAVVDAPNTNTIEEMQIMCACTAHAERLYSFNCAWPFFPKLLCYVSINLVGI